jgi:hypothetical protein
MAGASIGDPVLERINPAVSPEQSISKFHRAWFFEDTEREVSPLRNSPGNFQKSASKV